MAFILGDIISSAFCPDSAVVGIDHYTLRNCNGIELRWPSYTLTSAAPPPFDRWWMTDIPGQGAVAWLRANENELPPGAVFARDFSGLGRIVSEGDASLSSTFCSIACFRHGDDFRVIEIFDQSDGIVFQSRPLPPALAARL